MIELNIVTYTLLSGALLYVRFFGRVVQLARTNAQGGTTTETLSYTYSGPKRTNTGWTYDNHGNLTADPQAGLFVAWNAIDLPRTLTSSSTGTSRAYLADAYSNAELIAAM